MADVRGQMVVLGMHRSGTSAVARVVNLMGAWLGEPRELAFSDPASFLPMNERGLWERWDVMVLNEQVLGAMGCSWSKLTGFDPSRLGAAAKAAFADTARAIVADLDRHAPWLIKDPRLCLTFPLWRPLLRDPICIFVSRNPVEIARSLQKRDGFTLAHGIVLWERHLRDALAGSQGALRICVDYEALVADPVAEARLLLERLQALGVGGLRMPESVAIEGFLAGSLRHQRAGADELSQLLSPAQRELFESLRSGAALTS